MSSVIRRAFPARIAVASLAAALLLLNASGATGQASKANDLLDQQRRLNEVAGQKMEADVREALLDAQKIIDPVKAADRLKKALNLLENDTALTDKRRETLKRMLKDRIRVTETKADRETQPEATKAEKADRRYVIIGKRSEEDRRAAERDAITRYQREIADLQKQGKTREANRMADELARLYPDNPTARVASRTASVNDQLAAARRLGSDRGVGQLGSMREVERSAMASTRDYELPKDWKDRAGKRTTQPALSKKEQEILKTLNSHMTGVNFNNSRFEDVIEYLQTVLDQPIIVDPQSMKEAQVEYDTPVNFRVKLIGVRTLLRKVLGEVGLTYVVKDEVIQVTTVQRAREMMVTRVYSVADLASGGPFGNPLMWGPQLSQLQMVQNVNQIIELIKSSVEPDSWGPHGPGSIVFHPGAMAIIVRQSAEVHAVLGNSGLLR